MIDEEQFPKDNPEDIIEIAKGVVERDWWRGEEDIHALAAAILEQQAEIARLKDELNNALTAHDVLKGYADWSKAELIRLREVEKAALAQSEYIQEAGLTEYEMAQKDAAYALALDKIRDQESEMAQKDAEIEKYKTAHGIVNVERIRLTVENSRLKELARNYLNNGFTSARKELREALDKLP